MEVFLTINTTLNVFIDVGFDGGTYGCLMGDDQGATSHWGEECDASIWLDCWIDNCYYGTRSVQLQCYELWMVWREREKLLSDWCYWNAI